MAKTYFQQLDKWFPRGGKTLVVSGYAYGEEATLDELSHEEFKIYACPITPNEGVEELNANGYTITSLNVINEIATIAEFTVISDIPEGFAFILVSENEDEGGAFLTWSD